MQIATVKSNSNSENSIHRKSSTMKMPMKVSVWISVMNPFFFFFVAFENECIYWLLLPLSFLHPHVLPQISSADPSYFSLVTPNEQNCVSAELHFRCCFVPSHCTFPMSIYSCVWYCHACQSHISFEPFYHETFRICTNRIYKLPRKSLRVHSVSRTVVERNLWWTTNEPDRS